jgi:CheY-like chemotaxis protein
MAIFRSRRRKRAAASEETEAQSHVPRQPGPSEQLRERLREIAAAAAAPEDAIEPALRAILEASHAQLGAVCLFDQRHELLRLAAEVGLSDEGCRRLRSVKRGDPTSWDMPLSGLINRRAYLIESPARNRYVPRLAEDGQSLRTVACVPFYAGATPVGSLVLATIAPRSIAERDIRMLERPLGVLARLIEVARRRVTSSESLAPSTPALDLVGDVTARDHLEVELEQRLSELVLANAESARLRVELQQALQEQARHKSELEQARKDGEKLAAFGAALARAERERDRLAHALDAAASEAAEHARRETTLEQERGVAERAVAAVTAELATLRESIAASESSAGVESAESTAELERLRARLTEAESVASRERERRREHDTERERIAAELHVTRARERRLREELEAAVGRSERTAGDDLQSALDAVRAAEEARVAAIADAEAARTALVEKQGVIEALEEEAGRAHIEIERRIGAEREARIAAERVDASFGALRARERAASEQARALVKEADALRDERDRSAASAHARAAELARLGARVEALCAERDRLRDALTATEAERDRLVAAARDSAADAAHVGEGVATAKAALTALETAEAQHRAESAAHAAEIERLGEERARLIAERDSALADLAQRDSVPIAATPMRVVTVAPASGKRAKVREIESGRPLVTVIDTDNAWEGAQIDGHQVAVVPPGEGLAAYLAENQPARVLVNLAAPGALEACFALRAEGARVPLWGCVGDATHDRAIALGLIEPAGRPLDADAVLAALEGHAARGTRVITAGADVDALMSLRQALSRSGMSVSMAWDGKQAADLLGVVRPEVVVIDLELPRREGYGIVAQLAELEAAPTAVLVPGDDDAATGFAAALADPKRAGRAVSLATLLGALVMREATPAGERRPKVRALTGK